MEKKTKDNTPESFTEDLEYMVKQIKTEHGTEPTDEHLDEALKKEQELDTIKLTLKKIYTDTDITATKIPPRSSTTKKTGYLDGVDEQYRNTVAEYVQDAVTNSITSAVTKVQKENNPYLMDSFHDSLAYFIHEKMQGQGLLP